MKIFLICHLILLTFSSAALAGCQLDEVTFEEKTYSVCKTGKYGFLSKECKTAKECFPVVKEVLELNPTQNPAFTLCEKIKGKGIVAQPKSMKTKESFCLLNGRIVDMNQLTGLLQ